MEHEECHLLLPAYLHGKLSSNEQLTVQQHIARCALCFEAQQEAELLKSQLAEPPKAIDELISASAMRKNLDKTLNAIDNLQAHETDKQVKVSINKSIISIWLKNIREQWKITPLGSRNIIIGQFASILAVVGLLSVLVAQPGQDLIPSDSHIKTYQTLSEKNTTAIDSSNAHEYQVFRIIFHNAATELDMRTLINSIEGQIISGPSVSGVYTIATLKNEQQNSLILNTLRQSPWTKLAEPAVHRDQLASPAH